MRKITLIPGLCTTPQRTQFTLFWYTLRIVCKTGRQYKQTELEHGVTRASIYSEQSRQIEIERRHSVAPPSDEVERLHKVEDSVGTSFNEPSTRVQCSLLWLFDVTCYFRAMSLDKRACIKNQCRMIKFPRTDSLPRRDYSQSENNYLEWPRAMFYFAAYLYYYGSQRKPAIAAAAAAASLPVGETAGSPKR